MASQTTNETKSKESNKDPCTFCKKLELIYDEQQLKTNVEFFYYIYQHTANVIENSLRSSSSRQHFFAHSHNYHLAMKNTQFDNSSPSINIENEPHVLMNTQEQSHYSQQVVSVNKKPMLIFHACNKADVMQFIFQDFRFLMSFNIQHILPSQHNIETQRFPTIRDRLYISYSPVQNSVQLQRVALNDEITTSSKSDIHVEEVKTSFIQFLFADGINDDTTVFQPIFWVDI